jgi:hypothetical protein
MTDINNFGFRIRESKFDYFFGRVNSFGNQARSQQNLLDLNTLGIQEDESGITFLMQIFQDGLNAPEVSRKVNEYGAKISRTVIIRSAQVNGEIEISYLYANGDLSAKPEIITIIPRIYR